MKSLNLKVALILLTMGIVVIMVALTPPQGTLGCMMTEDACAQFAAMAARGAAIEFLVFSLSGIALISFAVFLLISGRNRGQSPSVGSS